MSKNIKALSLFANVGIAESNLSDVGVDVVLANELIEERGNFYQHVYPECEMIIGDITNKELYSTIIDKAIKKNVEFIQLYILLFVS